MPGRIMILPLLAVLCLAPSSAWAFSGQVVAVLDGDTFDVEHDGKRQRVRVFGIDAPEHDQPGGDDARVDLDYLIYGQAVEVEPPPDQARFPRSYNRIVGVVTAPDGRDVGLTMIGLGDAWAYRHFHPPRSYIAAEAQAKREGLDLWHQPGSIPPWEWRRQ